MLLQLGEFHCFVFWVQWSFLLLHLVYGWNPLVSVLVQVLYSSFLWLNIWYFPAFSVSLLKFSATSLTGDATSSLEPKKAWVPLLDWGGFEIAWQGSLHWALLKRLLSAFFWLRPDSPAGSRPPGTGGQYYEPCTCPRAGHSSSSLLLSSVTTHFSEYGKYLAWSCEALWQK